MDTDVTNIRYPHESHGLARKSSIIQRNLYRNSLSSLLT